MFCWKTGMLLLSLLSADIVIAADEFETLSREFTQKQLEFKNGTASLPTLLNAEIRLLLARLEADSSEADTKKNIRQRLSECLERLLNDYRLQYKAGIASSAVLTTEEIRCLQIQLKYHLWKSEKDRESLEKRLKFLQTRLSSACEK